MRVELINTGSELMLGFTANTHLSYLAGKLAGIGLRIDRQITVGDDRAELRAALADSLARADILLVTGGLGPTSDDCTREVVAELLGLKLVRNDAVAADITEQFRKRRFKMPDSVLGQAMAPVGAQVLPNRHGTAPGLAIEHAGKLVVLLPGPPRELRPMFEEFVLPVLPRGQAQDCRVFKVAGLPESIVEELVARVVTGVELGYCARPGEVEVRVIGPGAGQAERRIRAALGDNIFGAGDDRLEDVVVRMLAQAGKTVATAESCTGGYVANRLTNVSGASNVFLAGWVTYSNESKIRELGVREETLRQHGAVSEEVCREMAEGARQRSGADFALSATGIAGPTGGTAEKPVGLVFIGLAGPTGTRVCRHQLSFDRETFKWFASQTALDILRRELLAAGGGLGQPALPNKREPVGRSGPTAPTGPQ
jgi:nicotinamide-nucleotide amidase